MRRDLWRAFNSLTVLDKDAACLQFFVLQLNCRLNVIGVLFAYFFHIPCKVLS